MVSGRPVTPPLVYYKEFSHFKEVDNNTTTFDQLLVTKYAIRIKMNIILEGVSADIRLIKFLETFCNVQCSPFNINMYLIGNDVEFLPKGHMVEFPSGFEIETDSYTYGNTQKAEEYTMLCNLNRDKDIFKTMTSSMAEFRFMHCKKRLSCQNKFRNLVHFFTVWKYCTSYS